MKPLRLTAAATIPFLFAACTPAHRLGEFDFQGGRLAVVAEMPPSPILETGPFFVGDIDDPIGTVVSVGSRATREVAMRSAADALRRAAEDADPGAVLQGDLSRRASRHLGAEPWPSKPAADFLHEVYVREYGIEATDWDATAYFFIDTEVTLLDRVGGATIWRVDVQARDPVGPEVYRGGAVRDVVTAAAIADLGEEEMALALERLCDFTATEVSARLRDDPHGHSREHNARRRLRLRECGAARHERHCDDR